MSLLSVHSISALAERARTLISFAVCFVSVAILQKSRSVVLSSGKINLAGYKVAKAQSFLKAVGFKLKHVDLGFLLSSVEFT